jgi:integrase
MKGKNMSKSTRRTFGYVRKLPSGKYQASYLIPTGERATAPRTFIRKLEADSWLSEIRTDLNRGKWRDPNKGSITLKNYSEKYLEQSKYRLAPRTFQDYSILINQRILANYGSIYIGQLQLRQISPQVVKEWHKAIQEKFTAHNAAYCYRILRAILNEAIRDEIIETNSCKLRGASHVKSKRRNEPSVKQVVEILELTPERYKTAVLFAAFSGLRKGELFALRRSDVDLISQTVKVERAQVKLSKKPLLYGEPKTEAGKRTVALPSFLIADLKLHLNLFTSIEPDALIFTTEIGTPVYTLGKWWIKARKKLNVSYTWHDLRHTAGVITGQLGATLAELKHRLGHSSVQAALIYQHSTKERDKQLAQGIDEKVAKVIPFRKAI